MMVSKKSGELGSALPEYPCIMWNFNIY